MPPAELIRESPRREASELQRLAVVIPAWQPDGALPGLAGELAERGFAAVIVVDDGSDASCGPIFEAVAAIPEVRLLRQDVNLGKGRALKTGIGYVLAELTAVGGVVTADCDGQHRAEDIVRVGRALADALAAGGDAVVLGVRDLGQATPLRSRFGNAVTRCLFGWLTGVRVADTQTGLRGFSRAMLGELVALRGERYEFEMAVLVEVCRKGRPLELPIATVYVAGNRGSHFRPLRDSVRVFVALVRGGGSRRSQPD